VGRPGGDPFHPPFVERAGSGEGHERRVKGGGEVVQPQKLFLRGEGGVERRLHVGPDRARGQLEVQVRPGAPASTQEPLVSDGARLDRVTRIVADHGTYREGVSSKRIQGETELRGDLQRHLEVVQVVTSEVQKTGAWRCGYLHQGLHTLGLETARVEPFGLRRIPAPPQEGVGQVAQHTPPVNEEEFLLEASPASREVCAPLTQEIALRNLLW